MGNGVKQGRKLSPLLFNVYMDDLSVQLHAKSISCSLGTTVINHLIYADDLLLFAPNGKRIQTLLDCCYIYGCEYDVQFNASKSLIMYFDFEITLGRTIRVNILDMLCVTNYLIRPTFKPMLDSFMLRATCCVKNFTTALLP